MIAKMPAIASVFDSVRIKSSYPQIPTDPEKSLDLSNKIRILRIETASGPL